MSEARTEFETAIAAESRAAEAHRNRALLDLLQGNPAGWAAYESSRWQMADAPRINYSMPQWHGEPLTGKSLVLVAEQGLGDTMQFVRFAPLLAERGARVVLDCPTRMHALLSRVAGIEQLVAPGAAPSADYWVSLVSLPGLVQLADGELAGTVPYLHVDAELVSRWRQALLPVQGIKVGIVWQGNPGYVGDAFRSVPLAQFAPLAAVPGVRLISLQRGPGREQLARWSQTLSIIDLGGELDTGDAAFVDTAAVMRSLDLVISSDTSAAHLAGALGVPVWLALQLAPNWRWQLERTDSPWYPTMRLYRQERFNDWSEVFAAMARDCADRWRGADLRAAPICREGKLLRLRKPKTNVLGQYAPILFDFHISLGTDQEQGSVVAEVLIIPGDELFVGPRRNVLTELFVRHAAEVRPQIDVGFVHCHALGHAFVVDLAWFAHCRVSK